MKAPTAFLAISVLAACGSASGSRIDDPTSMPFSLGINVAPIGPHEGASPFANMIYGSSWQMQDMSGHLQDVPPSRLDSRGWVKSIPRGNRVVRELAIPFRTGAFVCTYQGIGEVDVFGSAVSGISRSAGTIRFNIASSLDEPKQAELRYTVNPGNYIRDVDCRAAKSSRAETFTPEFLAALTGFMTLRVMKWQTATEGNWPVTWASRNRPGDADYQKSDGVPVELLVDAANQARADLWVTIPWNADDDYVRRFAEIARDRLTPERQIYVEVSNEVWNGGYAVAKQAAAEALADRLPAASGSGSPGALERYAEKTKHVMAIWSAVFSTQEERLVRVASWQHVTPYFSNMLLDYANLDQAVDALATAPYFGYENGVELSLDQIMEKLPNQLSVAVNQGAQQKAVAAKHSLKYLTYEAGQSIVLPDVALEKKVQRDLRMYATYRQFINSWRSDVGAQLNLFALSGQIGRYGGWGLVEHLEQRQSETPKMRAVKDSLDTLSLRSSAATN